MNRVAFFAAALAAGDSLTPAEISQAETDWQIASYLVALDAALTTIVDEVNAASTLAILATIDVPNHPAWPTPPT